MLRETPRNRNDLYHTISRLDSVTYMMVLQVKNKKLKKNYLTSAITYVNDVISVNYVNGVNYVNCRRVFFKMAVLENLEIS